MYTGDCLGKGQWERGGARGKILRGKEVLSMLYIHLKMV
jgi:hypothetical protein